MTAILQWGNGRTAIRVGDLVQVKNRKKGGRTYESKVYKIYLTPDGGSANFETEDPKNGGIYLVPRDRIKKLKSRE